MTVVGDRTLFPGGAELGDGIAAHLKALICVALDNPALASANRFVVSVNMANGAYTIANASSSDGLARNVVATITGVTGNDTAGSILVTGTDIRDEVITETIAMTAGVGGTGTKAFKTVTSIVQSGWVINTGNDTIVIGTGTVIGLPVKVAAAGDAVMTALGTAIVAATVVAGGALPTNAISDSTIDASAATYDGAKDLRVFLRI